MSCHASDRKDSKSLQPTVTAVTRKSYFQCEGFTETLCTGVYFQVTASLRIKF